MKQFICCLLVFAGAAILKPAAHAAIRLPQLVSDGMVLQRNARVNIWGWADAAEHVRVTFHQHTFQATADAGGRWQIVFPPMAAGGPYTMELEAANRITIRDILIGEVWFCSGQSNMVLEMERVKERYSADIAAADLPRIRNFFVRTESDILGPHADLLQAKWVAATPKTVLDFGAASWFFARRLYEQFHVPIGIINSSVGGTPVQAWTSAEGLKEIEPYSSRLKQFSDSHITDSLFKTRMPWTNPLDASASGGDKGLTPGKTWYDPVYIPRNWHHFWLPGYWADQGVKGLNGVVWFRKEIMLPEQAASLAAKLFLGRIVDADQTYVNGQLVGSTTYQYPPRRYDVPAGLLKAGKNTLVIRVVNSSGRGGFVPDKPYFLAIGTDTTDLRGDWQYQVGQAVQPVTPKPEFSAQNEPAGLYNTMVAPAVNYTIKGFLWYQGESNISGAAAYGRLFKALIKDWRRKWRQGDLPFIYAQLPEFNEVQYLPSESDLARLREGQLVALSLPATGMAVILDAGEWNDIHPGNKKMVGDRLAASALQVAYGSPREGSGPLFHQAKVAGDSIEISFTHLGRGLQATGVEGLTQFALAGADKKFVWANTQIRNDKVLVWSVTVKYPLYVRYAWADNPEGANLFNKDGFPASPFRTDK